MKAEIRPRDQPRALIGQIPLCWDELSSVYATRQPHIVRGNRMRYKSGLMELVDYLFDFGDNKPRGPWKKTSYRFMYQRTLSLIEEAFSKPAAEEWGRQLKKLVIFTCWLLPYACKNTLFDRTKAHGEEPSKLMWFSSYQTNQPREFMELYNTRADSD
jgi:hypothetical protein